MTVDIGHHYRKYVPNEETNWTVSWDEWWDAGGMMNFNIWNNHQVFHWDIFHGDRTGMGIFHGIQSTIHINSTWYILFICFVVSQNGPDGPRLYGHCNGENDAWSHGNPFFLRHRRQLQVVEVFMVFMSVKGKSRLQLTVDERNPKHQLIPSGKLT